MRGDAVYQTHLLREGKNGYYDHKGRLWETGGGYPVCEVIYYGRSKKVAIAIAKACEFKAVVTYAYCAEVEFDNGKVKGRTERPYTGPLKRKRSMNEVPYKVILRFQYPAWDEKDGIPFYVTATSKNEACARARRWAELDGHIPGAHKGRVTR
jgi:hypothetical protein